MIDARRGREKERDTMDKKSVRFTEMAGIPQHMLAYVHIFSLVDDNLDKESISKEQRLKLYEGCVREYKKNLRSGVPQREPLKDSLALQAVQRYAKREIALAQRKNTTQYKEGKTILDALLGGL